MNMMFSIEPHIRALLFDCDGTLVDTMPLHWESWHETLGSFGVSCPQTYLDSFAGIPSEVIIKALNKRYGYALDHDHFVERKEKILYPKLQRSSPIEPVIAVVKKYLQKLPMAVVSGGTRKNVLASLKAVGLENHFGAIITADDPVAPKPSPDIFLEAARQLQVPARACQVFEDAESGLRAGKAAGMTVVDIREYLNA